MVVEIKIGSAGGEYMESVLLVEWRAKPGDRVSAGQVIAVVETAKAATEVEAPVSGVLAEILAEVGTEVAVHAAIGRIDDGGVAAPAPIVPEPPLASPAASPMARDEAAIPAVAAMPIPGRRRIIASPVARKLAAAAGIDLGAIPGTGPAGRIKRRDVEAARRRGGTPALAGRAQPLSLSRGGGGQGAPILLIHGFAGDAMTWWPLERALADRHRLIRIDLPGHGRSPAGRFSSFDGFAGAVVEAVRGIEDRPLHLVGHSLGGAVAAAIAAALPGAVCSLCMIAPAGLGAEINGAVLDGIARANNMASLTPWLKRLMAEPAPVDDAFARAAWAARSDPVLRAAQSALLPVLFPDGTQGFDIQPLLMRLEMPMKLIWGREDGILPWRQALAAPPHAGLHLLPRVGHVPHLESPDLVARLIGELVASAGR